MIILNFGSAIMIYIPYKIKLVIKYLSKERAYLIYIPEEKEIEYKNF